MFRINSKELDGVAGAQLVGTLRSLFHPGLFCEMTDIKPWRCSDIVLVIVRRWTRRLTQICDTH